MRFTIPFAGLFVALLLTAADEPRVSFRPVLLDFVLKNAATPQKHQIETMVGGVAAFDYDNDGDLDIFLPHYTHLDDGGTNVLKIKITQSGVHDGFAMRVPIYIELQDGRVIRLGAGTLRGNRSVQQEVALRQLPVKRAMLNYYYDVLALEAK